MRRIALLGLTLLLPACSTYAGNPFDGFGGFLSDTVNFQRNRNQPTGDSVNMNRVRGEDVATEPLLPEPGNVWPGLPKAEPTLGELMRQQDQEQPSAPPAPVVPHPQPRGSSTPPASVQPSAPAPLPLTPSTPRPAPPVSQFQTPPSLGVVQTPQGPAVITGGANGQQTFTLPNGGTGRAINNGNGTVTLIGPDGSVQSVPAPR